VNTYSEVTEHDTATRRNLPPAVLYLYFIVGLTALVFAPPLGWASLAVAGIAAATGIGLTRKQRVALALYAAIGVIALVLTAVLLFPTGVRVGEVDMIELTDIR